MNVHRPLSREDLPPTESLRRLGREILFFSEIDSTNAFLLRQAGVWPDGTLAFAELQTLGRGRLGRRWLAPRGSSVLCSALLIEDVDVEWLTLLPMLAGLAAAEAVEQATGLAAGVRWPNDIVLAGRKLGGVLIESVALGSAARRAIVIGVGLNVLQQAGHFAPEIVSHATSLEIASPSPVDRPAIARALVERLDAWLSSAAAPDAAQIRRAWLARSQDLGTRSRLVHDGRVFAGTIVDLDEHGDLVVQLDQGGMRCFRGAVTAREW